MPNLMRFSLCLFAGLLVSGLCLPVLMLLGRFDWIALLVATGKPLAHLALLLPGELWTQLTDVEDAANNPHVRSFLEMCMGVAQLGLLLALPIYRFGRQEKQS
ncbi:hypothetical protein ACQCLI_29330 [Pseudomonas nitroreducens]|uniref:hypothetical protein n=1 Tax=Pseudomonas TaxID=286 RepID=UPI0002F55AE9|nr:hypothetical protein [Pseudomonas nitroreducens]